MSLSSKPFLIDKRKVYEAYLKVRSKEGAGGVDGVTTEQFEKDLKSNLYKIWNRMSSGAYFPPPVRAVSIPKENGGQRILGVPTVADRVAQTVVKEMIEPALDKIFLADSYGYRPDKSALDAVGITRERCWKYDWVLEFDIKGLFDNIDHTLLMRAVRKHVTCPWVLLHIERWLTAPVLQEDGTLIERTHLRVAIAASNQTRRTMRQTALWPHFHRNSLYDQLRIRFNSRTALVTEAEEPRDKLKRVEIRSRQHRQTYAIAADGIRSLPLDCFKAS